MTKDYEQTLEQEREKLQKLADEKFDGKYWVLETCLSVKAQMLIEGISLPFFLILIGSASSLKTSILSIIEALPDCYRSDSFTPRSFVSHAANKTEENLRKIDLLPRIKNKILITPELGPMFSARDDKLQENIGTLTRILDGHGYWSESGARGGRGYKGNYYFTWLGAVVSVSRHVMKIIGNLGPKIYFLHVDGKQISDEEKQQQILQKIENDSHSKDLEEAKKQIQKLWELITKFPKKENEKIIWNKSNDNIETKKKIASLSMLLAKLRTGVTFEEIGGQVQLRISAFEDPSRAATLMQYLARGHAVIYGRNYITDEDLSVVIVVALSSAYRERTDLLRTLLENNGDLNTDQIIEKMKVSRQTALNMMKEFEIVGIVDRIKQESETKPVEAIKLKELFSWLLSDEYKKYLK